MKLHVFTLYDVPEEFCETVINTSVGRLYHQM